MNLIQSLKQLTALYPHLYSFYAIHVTGVQHILVKAEFPQITNAPNVITITDDPVYLFWPMNRLPLGMTINVE